MTVRALIYDVLGIGMMLASLFFLYRCVEFLAQKDYVAGVLTLGIGIIVIRAGVEIGRLGVLVRRED